MEPVPAIPLQYAHVASPARYAKALRVLALLAWINCVLGFALIGGVEVETVLGTGPCLFALGMLILLLALYARSTPYAILGASHCALCLLFFVLVWRLDWSPGEARVPFSIMSGIYCIASAFAGLWIQWGGRAS